MWYAVRTSNSSMSPSEKNESMVSKKGVLFITATWIIYHVEFAPSHVIDYKSFLETVEHRSSGHKQEGVTQQLII